MQCIRKRNGKKKDISFSYTLHKKESEKMITPQSYTCSKCGQVYNAKDANNDINPTEVKAAVDNLVNALNDATTSIVNAIRKVEPDAENAFKQDETKTIVPSMEESCTMIEKAISNNATAIENEDLPGKAERVHDELQTNYNNEASTNAQKCAESHQSSDS